MRRHSSRRGRETGTAWSAVGTHRRWNPVLQRSGTKGKEEQESDSVLSPEGQLGEDSAYPAQWVRLEWRCLVQCQEYAGGCIYSSALSWDRSRLRIYWWVQKCAPHCLTSELVYAVSHHLASALASHLSPTSLPPSSATPVHCQASCHSPNMWPGPLCRVWLFLCRHCAVARYAGGNGRSVGAGGWLYQEGAQSWGLLSVVLRVFSKNKNLCVFRQWGRTWADRKSGEWSILGPGLVLRLPFLQSITHLQHFWICLFQWGIWVTSVMFSNKTSALLQQEE